MARIEKRDEAAERQVDDGEEGHYRRQRAI